MKYIYRVHFQLPVGHRTYHDYKTRNIAMLHYGDKGWMAKSGWKSLRIEVLDRKTMKEVGYKNLIIS